jgi:1-acyl-sn-glycerol-3-phosphate acyltransferase
VARAAFERERRALPAAPAPAAGEGEPLVFVSGGAPLPGHEIRIVDDAGHELPDRREGQVEFRGPSATRGYLRNERATRALRDGDWLRTGDLGYVAEGELFVTGRNKDVIIRAGRHVFPYELEELVGGVPGVRRGGVAVFAHASHEGGTEKLVVVAETRLGADDDRQRAALRGRIEGQAAALLGAAPDEIVLAPPRTVPKTSSGKIRRAACRDLYLRGQLGARPSVRRQVVALAAHALVPLGRRTFQRLGALAYAVWFWACWAALAVPAWVLALAVPGGRARWRAVSAVARAFFAAAGIRVDLEGRARLAARPSVLVLNHASNLDSMALLAVLPPGFSFVAKRELARNPLLRPALRRLGVVLVERFDPQRSVEDAARMEATLRAGRSLVVFPEGTNRRIPGLFPFHLGAFLAAAQTGAPLVPAGITGTRAVLRPDQSFPRRSDAPIRIAVLPALAAGAGSWSAAVALRDGARRAIAGATGETLVG